MVDAHGHDGHDHHAERGPEQHRADGAVRPFVRTGEPVHFAPGDEALNAVLESLAEKNRDQDHPAENDGDAEKVGQQPLVAEHAVDKRVETVHLALRGDRRQTRRAPAPPGPPGTNGAAITYPPPRGPVNPPFPPSRRTSTSPPT